MKKITSIIILLFIFGCSPEEMDRIVIHYGFDFTKYSAENFLITPEAYQGEYESIGLINTTIIPSMHKKEPNKTKWYPTLGDNSPQWDIENIKPQEVIDEIVKKAKDMGANALTKFSVTTHYIVNGNIPITSYEVSGFAIKRK